MRTSGFAPWETQRAELVSVPAHWPSLNQADFLRCLIDLAQRQPRHGL